MRTIIGVVLVMLMSASFTGAFAQGHHNKDKGKQNGPPSWAPAKGFRKKTKQIYFPEQNMYYDVDRSVYIYAKGNNWEVSASLPSIFANVNLNTAKQVEMKLDTDAPQKMNAEHVKEYGGKTDSKSSSKGGGDKGKGKK